MLKVLLLLSSVFEAISARGCEGGRCSPVSVKQQRPAGSFDGNMNVARREGRQHRRDSVADLCGEEFGITSSSGSCESEKADCFSSSSSECRRKRRRRERSCSSSSSSSSSQICAMPVPRPVNNCTVRYESLLRSLDAALIAAIRTFEAQYRQQILTFLGTVSADISAFNPNFLATDYPALITALIAIVGEGVLPTTLAADLQAIEIAAIANVTASIQLTIGGVLGDLFVRVETMCLPELIDLVTSGLLTSQLTAAFTLAVNEITPIVNAMLASQLTLIANLGLIEAAVTLATTTLTTGATNLITALTAVLGILATQVGAQLTALLTSLGNLLTTGVTAFQNLAISEINALVAKVFGSTGVPPPIPPVV